MPIQPHKSITKVISNNTFSLSWHPVFSHNPKLLSEIEFARCLELFTRKFPNQSVSPLFLVNRYEDLYSEIIELESNFHEELQKIAVDIIREIYNIPDEINLSADIIEEDEIELDSEDQDNQKDKFEDLPESQQNKIMLEVKKRIILNSIVNGSSVLIWKSVHYLAKEKIDKLNPQLFELYNSYIALVNMMLWQQDIDFINENFDIDQSNKQGQCNIEEIKENNELKIKLKALAINMPVLLMETNKVAMDYLILHGVPSTFSSDELDIYYALADDYKDEIWHNLLSPTIYSDFLEVIDKNPVELPKIIMKLAKWNYKDLEKLFIFVQSDKEKAKEFLKYKT